MAALLALVEAESTMDAMATCQVLQHVPHEECGRIGALLQARGLVRDDRLLYQGDAVPAADEADLMIVMGGPMGVGDLHDPLFPFLPPEAAMLASRVAQRRPTLGICLGAQLIAHVAGAKVYPNARVRRPGLPAEIVREVGWGAITLLSADREPAFAGLPATPMVLHWHGDTYDLPPGAVWLASTPLCPHQAFRLGHHAYALQFHAEIEAAQVPVWCAEDAAFVRKANGPDGCSRLLADNERWGVATEAMRDRMLSNILDQLLAVRPA